MKNFFDAVRAHDPKVLNAPVEIGHSSAGWAHVINAAVRAADEPGLVAARRRHEDDGLRATGPARPGSPGRPQDRQGDRVPHQPVLNIDDDAEKFTGEGADAANVFLDKPNYRGDYAIKV